MSDLIITRTPYRISLGGGGTDLPFYSNLKEGFLITAAINQYCTVSISERSLDDIILTQTTVTQFSDSIDEVENAIIRECLRYFGLLNSIQVSTYTTLPSGIGLGTSSTLTVGLINAILGLLNKKLSKVEIARLAYKIEREIIGLKGGIQDQYIAALGGIQILRVSTSGDVQSEELIIDSNNRKKLEENLVLVYTKQERESHKIISSQEVNKEKSINVYDQIKVIGKNSVDLLVHADIERLGQLMDQHWLIKRSLSNEISTSIFDKLYMNFKSLGSPGGKIIGAGGGGFFMMAVPKNVKKFKMEINKMGYRTLDWCFDQKGTYHLSV